MDYKNWLNTAVRPESEERVQGMFSSVARRYDLANTAVSFGMHYPWKTFMVNQANLSPGDTALDVCAGTCDIAMKLAREVGPTGHVVALDRNEEMLEVGKYKLRKHGLLDRSEIRVGDAEAMPELESESFNAVTIGVASRHLDVAEAYKEWYRLLKPGGRVICLDFFQPPNDIFRSLYTWYSKHILPPIGEVLTGDKTGVYHYLNKSIELFFSPEEYSKIIEDAGFKNVRYTSKTGGIACIHVGEKPL